MLAAHGADAKKWRCSSFSLSFCCLVMAQSHDSCACILDMKSNNYEVVEAGETISFRGVVQRSLSQAFFLTFCTALGLLSLALVLQIQFNSLTLPVFGEPNWFLLALLSPYAGIYYWRSGDRVDDCSVKLMTNEDETENEIVVQGSEEELERMWRTLDWKEKGMVKIDGLLVG
jgi:Cofactor assembly of complex C subunit B